ncbi:DsbE family thiol:disulfide interchange protein (plasmid) [Rhizobium grahamii]|uniref:DsbE family thiol:disulfide interchange protein n=1 Tax=Rhizobium grahamii TaxID=1120045 RepID=A0A5Q0CFM9_9HYPH|nr:MULTISPECIES: DsbE family thiol:disulfide interchange protein [Rhizobium]QFY62771.1 DsbE family thiol:disulfide interchange protein [Rhizobium grahamii]QRM52483.1 DsbE family thiol:disulfide interchange protein [Rhizobium sp. BG6]
MIAGRRLAAAIPLVVFLGFAAAVGNNLYREAQDGYSPTALPSALIGAIHPPLALPRLEEGLSALSEDVIKDSVTVVNVFASWCVPCRQEHPLLMRLSSDARVKVVGINYKDDAKDATAFLQSEGNPYAAVGTDRSGRQSIEWGVYGVPETFVLDKAGRIVFKHVGPLDQRAIANELQPLIEQLSATGNP